MKNTERLLALLMALLLVMTGCAGAETVSAGAETQAATVNHPITGEELEALAAQIRALAEGSELLNGETAGEALSEDGYELQFDFCVLYADRPEWTQETVINDILLMDSEIAGPRGVAIDWDVNRLLTELPCDNPEMNGTRTEAALYLAGDPERFFYARAERDGQRITAVEYGEADAGTGRKIALVLGISGDGVSQIRIEGLGETFSPESLEELYRETEDLRGQYVYARVPRSLQGTELEKFQEADLFFSALSYPTAEPEIFGENVEDMLIDNGDGTWLRRIDGEGFEAVFVCDSRGKDARIMSYTILSPELEGPRCVRLGDYFHEDFTRFRSGEGELSADGRTEVLYGTVGAAPVPSSSVR